VKAAELIAALVDGGWRERGEKALKHIDWAIELIENPSPGFVSTSGYLTGEQIGKILRSIKDAKTSLTELEIEGE